MDGNKLTFAIGTISRAMGMLKYAKKYLPLDTVKNMYTSIVEPHFRNCYSVWGCCGEILLDKLQNRAAQIVTNSSYDASSLPLIGSLGWLAIKEMIVFNTATAVYKSLHGLAPEYMQLMFTKLLEMVHGLSVIPTQILEYLALQPLTGNVVSDNEA